MIHLEKRSIMHNIVISKPIAKVQGVKADQNSTKLPKIQKEKKKIYKTEKKKWKIYTKNEIFFYKNKKKRGDDPTPTPKSHNVLIGSCEPSPTHKNKENKIKNQKNIQNRHIYTPANTLSQKYNLTQNNDTITHIYKLTPPKTIIDHTNNTTNHNTVKIHKNTRMVIIANNGSTTSTFHH